MFSNSGEVTYGRPDYDLYKSERPVGVSDNQPPSSQDICESARNKWDEWRNLYSDDLPDKVGWEIRVELSKIQFEHACYK